MNIPTILTRYERKHETPIHRKEMLDKMSPVDARQAGTGLFQLKYNWKITWGRLETTVRTTLRTWIILIKDSVICRESSCKEQATG